MNKCAGIWKKNELHGLSNILIAAQRVARCFLSQNISARTPADKIDSILPTVIRDNCPKASRLSYYKNPTSLKSGKTNDDTGFDLFLGLSRVSHMTLGKDREASKRYSAGLEDEHIVHQKAPYIRE